MALESIHGPMVEYMKDTGMTVEFMEKVNSTGLTEDAIKENINRN